jgi:hypothetical protein
MMIHIGIIERRLESIKGYFFTKLAAINGYMKAEACDITRGNLDGV